MSIDEIRARWEKATPGPWKAVRHDLSLYVEAESGELNPIKLGYVGNHPESDAEFIAHAPTDVARLLAAVEGVEKRLAQWEERFTGMASDEVAMRAAIYLIRQAITSALDPS